MVKGSTAWQAKLSFIPLVIYSDPTQLKLFLSSFHEKYSFPSQPNVKFKYLWGCTICYMCSLSISIQLQSPAHFIFKVYLSYVSVITFITWTVFTWAFILFCLPLYILNVHTTSRLRSLKHKASEDHLITTHSSVSHSISQNLH